MTDLSSWHDALDFAAGSLGLSKEEAEVYADHHFERPQALTGDVQPSTQAEAANERRASYAGLHPVKQKLP